MVHHSGCGQTRSDKFQAIRLRRAVTLDVHAEEAATSLNHLEPVADGKLDHLGHFCAVFPFGKHLEKLLEDALRLENLVDTVLETGEGVTLGAHHLVELDFGINAVWMSLADITSPT